MTTHHGRGSVYRKLSHDMREGLKGIYRQISEASSEGSAVLPDPDPLFTEASDQLNEVMKTTEAAAMSIMELVEKHMELQAEGAELLRELAKPKGGKEEKARRLERLQEINAELETDLTSILTTLSFQDLTGQRIRKVVQALKRIEQSVVELYVSSGLIMKRADAQPDKDAGELEDEAHKAVEDFRKGRKVSSELKGPEKGSSQGDIDDMLAQLGL
ncbi:MAG: protein phosphatase CheZ [Desulfovibrio sp.]|jgi:chemotaxis protein CheZ|nr:protein phosphatase CheZ [Desulfovibrio sp.]